GGAGASVDRGAGPSFGSNRPRAAGGRGVARPVRRAAAGGAGGRGGAEADRDEAGRARSSPYIAGGRGCTPLLQLRGPLRGGGRARLRPGAVEPAVGAGAPVAGGAAVAGAAALRGVPVTGLAARRGAGGRAGGGRCAGRPLAAV